MHVRTTDLFPEMGRHETQRLLNEGGSMSDEKLKCRSCESENLQPLISLGDIPLVNNLTSSSSEKFERFPLDVVICSDCSLAQLKDTVPPEAMFSEYLFYSSVMAQVVDRAEQLVEKVTTRRNLEHGLVIEIASNDGYLLDFYRKKGISVLGVD